MAVKGLLRIVSGLAAVAVISLGIGFAKGMGREFGQESARMCSQPIQMQALMVSFMIGAVLLLIMAAIAVLLVRYALSEYSDSNWVDDGIDTDDCVDDWEPTNRN